MSGHKPFANLRKAIDADPKRRARVEREKQIMIDVLALTRLAEARGVTQEELAQAWEVTQSNISQVECGQDVYLSTLHNYVEALGGHLEIRAVFPGQIIALGADPDLHPDDGVGAGHLARSLV